MAEYPNDQFPRRCFHFCQSCAGAQVAQGLPESWHVVSYCFSVDCLSDRLSDRRYLCLCLTSLALWPPGRRSVIELTDCGRQLSVSRDMAPTVYTQHSTQPVRPPAHLPTRPPPTTQTSAQTGVRTHVHLHTHACTHAHTHTDTHRAHSHMYILRSSSCYFSGAARGGDRVDAA